MIGTRPDVPQPVWDLIARTCEGSLSETEIDELNTQLVGHPQRQRALLDYCSMHVNLLMMVDINQTVENVRKIVTSSPSVSTKAVGNVLPDVERRLSQVPRELPLRFGSHLLSIRGPVMVATLLVAFVSYGAFALIAWNLRPDQLPTRADDAPSSVAIIRNTADVQWSYIGASKSARSSILLGEPLTITSGTMELELNAGTKLVVEGPADWSIDGDNRVSLRAGKLFAHVPENAIGFTIETPTATIVDLGTEFAVETDSAGRTDVEVVAGKVDVHYGAATKSSELRQTVRMSAGQARQFSKRKEAGPVTVVDVKPGTKSWVAKSMSKLGEASKVPVSPGEARLILSLNADAGVTNTSSAPAANGDSVGTWADQSGNNNNATKLEAISAPILRTNALNSRAVVTFAASGNGEPGQELVISPLTGNLRGQQFTVFLVGKIEGNQAVTSNSSDYFFDGIDEHNRVALGLNGNNKLSFFGSQSINYLREDFADSSADSTVWTGYHIYQVLYNGAGSALFVDGELKVPVAAGPAGDAALTNMLLGARYNHQFALNGAIANVQIYVGALSKAQQNKIGAALQSYYGIKGNYEDVSASK
jgi:hypothetical protein